MSSAQNWHKWLVLSLFGLALSARSIGCDYSSITEKFGADAVARCNEKCPFQNRTGDGHFDVNCGSDCSLQQCKLGCSLWQQALEHSCQTVCNVTSDTVLSRELYCVMGCNEALNTYFQNLRDLVGTPSAPALVADSLTATSLSLTWEPKNLINMSYLVQWRYEELPGPWQYYSNASYSDGSIINVENLQPYTKYRFRVAIFLSGRGSNGEPIYSEPSVVISTSGSGKPSSAPSALRAAAPDASRVAISWEPGPFPNGPLISYVLRLTDTQPNTTDVIEDMPASNNTLFYMFQNLAPAREYEVSVTMRNAVGEGPRAYVRVATPSLPISAPSQQPILILGSEHNILAASANDMLSDPVELYSTEHIITGVGLDVTSDSLFISVSDGFVHRSSLSKKSSFEPVMNTEIKSYKPLDLSVDWLNRHLYILGEVYYTKSSNMTEFPNWEISRCDFDGKNQLIALSGFNLRPIHFEVDPYNGYLFYTLSGVERGGLYRLDLANISNGVHHDEQPEMIVRDSHLGAFTVDHADFRILVAHVRRNTVLAVSLDGREVTDFRINTQTPMFKSTRSIAYANGLFYWTNGKKMLTEEYHAQSDSYFHIEYPLAFNTKPIETRQVLVALRSCQPIPVPVNPPLGVQSVMGISRAKVSWAAPHLLGHQGSGAWQHWTYHLQLTHLSTGDVIDIKDIKDFSYVVENLKPDAEYVIRVAAVTISGSGPWSTEFVGKTLAMSPSNLYSTLLWSGPDGLLQTDLTGENLQTLIHKSEMEKNNYHITDISWYRDKLYLVTNDSMVRWFNTTSHEMGVMQNMENVGSLAVDWVGKKIYWSNPKQQLISRSNFDGSNREPVPIVTVAKELVIDALEAHIYWNTGHAVEAARLSGDGKVVYYPAQLFSGKQVMGITIDLENKWLYWLVRSYDGSELHRAPTADVISTGSNELGPTLVSRLGGPAALGPLCYFSGRVVWGGGARAVLADPAGRHPARLAPAAHLVAVRDPTTHQHSESLVAIPEMINPSSIAIEGTWDEFNVTWAPVTNVNVNNSRVYYDVSLNFNSQNKIEKTVWVPWVVVRGGGVAPYSGVRCAVRAASAWGAGPAAARDLRTPAAPPATPHRPRAYTQLLHSGGGVSAWFRWAAPRRANGVVGGYEAQCWWAGGGRERAACAARRLPPAATELRLVDLQPNATYYFRVRAFTEGGAGPFSEVVSVSSDELNPVPRVMLSSQEAIKIVDLDNGDSEIIPKTTGIPVDFAISLEENVVFWANTLEEIFSSRINVSGHYKLVSINGSAISLCVDWVSRSVYYNQREADLYVTYRADLGPPMAKPHITRLFNRNRPMHSMQIAPMHQSLFWFEEGSYPGLGMVMKSNLNGSDIETFFNNTKDLDQGDCNCPENPDTSKSFVVDLTKGDDYELYWIDPWMHRIVASDMYGCKCRIVFNATESKKFGFTPMSLTVDSKHVYWFNSTQKEIYYTDKYNHTKVEHVKVTHGYKIMALDPASQKYPPKRCLFPESQSLLPKVISNTAYSLTLQMPPIEKPQECRNLKYELTIPEYTIYYRINDSNDTTVCDRVLCPFITSTNTEVTLNDLKPFTNYSVMLEATNYYLKLHEKRPIVGSRLVLQTAAEAPVAPKNVKAIVLSPELAQVEWTPVPGLRYEVHWRTDDFYTTQDKLKEHSTLEVGGGAGRALVPRLAAGTRYAVWVRARSPHAAAASDSAVVRLRTRALPAAPHAPRAASRVLALRWPAPSPAPHRYGVEFTEATAPLGRWRQCEEVAAGEWEARDLRPKTRYRFRLRLQYVADAPLYYWPPDDRFTYETLGDVPGAPGAVRAEAVGERVVRAWWAEPDDRGAPVTHYRLWGRALHRTVSDENVTADIDGPLPPNLPPDLDDDMKRLVLREGLELLHNGTETYWLIGAEQLAEGYWVQVQARNSYGWGALSPRAQLQRAAPAPAPAALALAAAAALAVLLVVALAALLAYNNRSKKKKAVENRALPNAVRRGPDVELATLRQLPIRHSTNILYNQGVHCPSDAEIANLPHIRREEITLTKFLGSGAFGEVFEGIARQINGATADTKVAVKTLRKGATEQEKTEFLKEAALMSNFKHEHILRLLGVCLDNDPHYIIMELMEGGDLLSYLRTKRSSLYTGSSLTLLDLLNMCVDVTRGCRYLEEMHFVHRDLAARNCLVARGAAGRVVKIGDFGLARDIYKNDYYRKEGEGLLPVRWMAVECLVDGVFSCQSDVWAWGVLCWEVLSLGQQPYPARTNRQVLAYVRSGGKPDRPPNCPSVFYELLQKCWRYNAEARPSFRHCLEVVTTLRDKTSPNITLTATPQPPPDYLTLLSDGVSSGRDTNYTSHCAWAACSDAVDNRTYLLDENDNARVESDGPEDMEPSRALAPAPHYLQLMYGDGYEVPLGARARHSVAGGAGGRTAPAPRRSASLRARRPPNATIVPLRAGAAKRASLCAEGARLRLDFDDHVFKTPF